MANITGFGRRDRISDAVHTVSSVALISLGTAGVLNIILNVIFAVAFKMDAAGVALATVLANCLSGGLIVYFLIMVCK